MKKITLSILFIILFSIPVLSQEENQQSIKQFVQQQDPFSKLELKLDRVSIEKSTQNVSPVIKKQNTASSEDEVEDEGPSKRKKLLVLLGGAAWIAAMLLIFQGTGGGSSAY